MVNHTAKSRQRQKKQTRNGQGQKQAEKNIRKNSGMTQQTLDKEAMVRKVCRLYAYIVPERTNDG